MLATALWLGGCSPTFNWRDLRTEGTPLRALMPCKPETAVRSAPLAGGGKAADLHMSSCETGGLRFAVAWVDVSDPGLVPSALMAWRDASLLSIQVDATAADPARLSWPVAIAGAHQVLGVRAQGRDPQGRPVQSRAVYFSHGGLVFQAAVYGASLPDEPVQTFFASLGLPPA